MIRNKKTGKIINGCFIVCEYKDGARFSVNDKPVYKSISKLNEDYEDVKEPLIKDEKICKLVKEWATLFEEHRKIKYYEYNDFVVFRLCREEGTYDPELDISIDYELVNLREGYEYDFEELCGEEEE